MAKFRIHAEYPVYPGGSCIPYTIYFVQKLEEGFFCNKWIDIKGFESRQKAEDLLKLLK